MLRLILLHQAEEWLYFHRGQARATVFLGGAIARTFDFTAGDTAVFPDNSGMNLKCLLENRSRLTLLVRPLRREYFEDREVGLD